MSFSPQRVLMAAAGALVLAAGLLAAPGAGGAVVDNPPAVPTSVDLSSSSIVLPGEADPIIKQVEELTKTTVTSTTTTTTTTTPSSSTTSTVATTTSTTTTSTTLPAQPLEEAPGEPLSLEALLAQIEVPVIDVEALAYDYHRSGFPAYTPRFGKRSTLEVVELLAGRGASFEQTAAIMAPFPVAGAASYTDDWGAARYNPTFHLHEGTDIFAAGGTPVIAVMDGTVSRIGRGTAVGGNSVYTKLADGTYFYYAHLDEISDLIYEGMPVRAGQVLGTVGNSGNAEGGAPHLHFEIHPGGGDPVPPAPYLDAWLASAFEKAKQFAGVGKGGGVPPPFPTPFEAAPGNAGVLHAEPASFGRESTESLLFIVPGALVLWWRRRRAAAVLSAKGIIQAD